MDRQSEKVTALPALLKGSSKTKIKNTEIKPKILLCNHVSDTVCITSQQCLISQPQLNWSLHSISRKPETVSPRRSLTLCRLLQQADSPADTQPWVSKLPSTNGCRSPSLFQYSAPSHGLTHSFCGVWNLSSSTDPDFYWPVHPRTYIMEQVAHSNTYAGTDPAITGPVEDHYIMGHSPMLL